MILEGKNKCSPCFKTCKILPNGNESICPKPIIDSKICYKYNLYNLDSSKWKFYDNFSLDTVSTFFNSNGDENISIYANLYNSDIYCNISYFKEQLKLNNIFVNNLFFGIGQDNWELETDIWFGDLELDYSKSTNASVIGFDLSNYLKSSIKNKFNKNSIFEENLTTLALTYKYNEIELGFDYNTSFADDSIKNDLYGLSGKLDITDQFTIKARGVNEYDKNNSKFNNTFSLNCEYKLNKNIKLIYEFNERTSDWILGLKFIGFIPGYRSKVMYHSFGKNNKVFELLETSDSKYNSYFKIENNLCACKEF